MKYFVDVTSLFICIDYLSLVANLLISHGSPNFLWRRATSLIVASFASRTRKSNSKWYT